MNYRKFSAERIFNNGEWVENSVLITSDDGRVEAIVPLTDAGEGLQRVEGFLTPGFINCHCHLELSHMKGRVPEGTGLVDFVYHIVTGRHSSPDEIAEAIGRAEDEMLRTGTVAVGDICNNTNTLEQKKKRRLHYSNFVEASGWLPSAAEARLGQVLSVYEAFRQEGEVARNAERYFRTALVPHAPYSVSAELWARIRPYMNGKTVSIHNQETAFEDEFFLQGTGDFNRMYQMMNMDNSHHQPHRKTSLQSYYSSLSGASSILLVHNTFTGGHDMDFIRTEMGEGAPATFFCLCINANQYIERSLPPVRLLREKGLPVVLGTDSLASNHSLRLIEEVNTIRSAFPEVPLEEVLLWATANGAKALQMDDVLGSFDGGKKPGIVQVTHEQGRLEACRLL